MRNVHKLNILAASVAVAAAGNVNAGALGADNEIFVGGATAPANFIREDLLRRICDPAAAPVQVFTEEVETVPSTTPGGNILNAGNHQVIRCTAGAAMGASAGEDIAVYKLNGGSASGVAPVSESLALDFLDASVAGCAAVEHTPGDNTYPIGSTADVYELYECTDAALIVNQVPDAGVSDVEPKVFTGSLALDFGVEPTGTQVRPTVPLGDVSNMNVKAGPGLIFGTGVSINMYDELLEDQVAIGMLPAYCDDVARGAAGDSVRDTVECMPSLPSTLIRASFEGRITSWADFKPYGESLDPARVNQGNNVHLCKRTNGSGTHAQFSVNFLQTNCLADSNLAMLEQNDGVSAEFVGIVGMYANRGSSDMDDCIDALGNGLGFDGDFASLPQSTSPLSGDSSVVPGSALASNAVIESDQFGAHPLGLTYDNGGVPFTAYGMGYNSLEKNTDLSFDYRFVKVDGVAPTLEKAVAGEYKDIYYLSYQNRAPIDQPLGDIRTVAGSSSVLADYFATWNSTAPAALAVINEGLVVDPDGAAASGDEWQGGYLSPVAGASAAYTPGVPATPWGRQAPGTNAADSCQELSTVR